MAFQGDNYNSPSLNSNGADVLKLSADGGQTLHLPDSSYIKDSHMVRDGMDLVLEGPDGTVVIEGYFVAEPVPNLAGPGGETLTPHLVDSFLKSPMQYADAGSMSDESPVGAVQEVSGEATVTRTDGSVETITIGTPIYQGDVVETDAEGAVNIFFVDETSFAVSEDARLAIDEYIFDPVTQSGSTNFSVLKGVFVFTSGLIGRDDPDDVRIDTPVGSIGIRGTIIAGDVDNGEITVVEGAIVLKDFAGNEMTLATQFETAKFNMADGSIDNMGQLSANDVTAKFTSISNVSPNLFSSINDAAQEQGESSEGESSADAQGEGEAGQTDGQTGGEHQSEAAQEATPAPAPAQGTGLGPSNGGLGGAGTNAAAGTQASTTQAMAGSDAGSPTGGQAAGNTGQTAPSGNEPTNPNVLGGGNNNNPFGVQVLDVFDLQDDNDNGQILAKFQVQNGTVLNTAVSSVDVNHAGKFELVQTGANQYDLKLKPGFGFDYDYLAREGVTLDDLNVTFTDTNGHVASQTVGVDVYNVDEAPEHHAYAPGAYFEGAAEGVTWSYHFDKEFHDPDYGDTLTYSLSADTITSLTNLETNGVLEGIGGRNAWSFNAADGYLELNFADDFSGDQSIDIDITATDDGGNVLSHNYEIEANGNLVTRLSGNIYNNNGDYLIDAGNQDVYVDGSNNHIYLSSDYTGKLVLNGGDSNSVFLGNENNIGGDGKEISVEADSRDNSIIGSGQNDLFDIHEVRGNHINGMDGNDSFKLDQASLNMLRNPSTTFRLDGGHDLVEPNNPAGYGDILKLGNSSASIDFRLISDEYIKNIETIDTTGTSGTAQSVILSYTDVIAMTDHENHMIFKMDNQDNLTFDTEGHTFSKGAQQTIGGDTYDAYTDGSVTLLVDVDAASVTGLPA